MSKFRVIARLDVKNEFVIKGIHLEGLRKVGDPNEMAKKYYEHGVDEIFFMDAVAAYYDRNSLAHIIKLACQDVFVPITVGGGIRTLDDIQIALNAGADKVAINTQAIKTPEFIEQASRTFGSQCIVSSIDAKKVSENKWEVYMDNGREHTGLDVCDWVKRVERLGAGEILLTSIDKEGTKKGFDIELNKSVSEITNIPLISCGGAGSNKDIHHLLHTANIDGVAIASLLHYRLSTINDLKQSLHESNISVRTCL